MSQNRPHIAIACVDPLRARLLAQGLTALEGAEPDIAMVLPGDFSLSGPVILVFDESCDGGLASLLNEIEGDSASILGGILIGEDDRTEMPVTPFPLHRFSYPVRMGALRDLVRRLLHTPFAGLGAVIAVGPYDLVLDTALLRKAQPQEEEVQDVVLTEKERDLLVRLYRAGGAAVKREVLLQDIWGYREGLETHTLETHIYRLRQKLEEDATAPAVILTLEDGYALAMPSRQEG